MSTEHPDRHEHLDRLRGKGDGFRTPEPAYFEQLARRAVEAAEITPSRKPAVVRSLWQRPRRLALAAAAAVALLLCVWQFALAPATAPPGDLVAVTPEQAIAPAPSSDELLAELDPAEVDAYIDRYFFEFEELVEYNYLND